MVTGGKAQTTTYPDLPHSSNSSREEPYYGKGSELLVYSRANPTRITALD